LGISENAVLFNTSTVLIAEEEKESQTYPGLPSLYRKRIITANLALAEDLPVLAGVLSISSIPPLTQPAPEESPDTRKSPNNKASLTVPGTVAVEDFA
jgi:hypothetical protein